MDRIYPLRADSVSFLCGYEYENIYPSGHGFIYHFLKNADTNTNTNKVKNGYGNEYNTYITIY